MESSSPEISQYAKILEKDNMPCSWAALLRKQMTLGKNLVFNSTAEWNFLSPWAMALLLFWSDPATYHLVYLFYLYHHFISSRKHHLRKVKVTEAKKFIRWHSCKLETWDSSPVLTAARKPSVLTLHWKISLSMVAESVFHFRTRLSLSIRKAHFRRCLSGEE